MTTYLRLILNATKRAQTKLAAREKQRLISKKMAEPGDIPPCNTTTQRQTQDSDITQVSKVISKVYIRYGVGGCSLLLYEPFDANWGKVIVLG